jgi:hypothetical protein
MTEDKSQTKSVEATSVEATRAEVTSTEGTVAARATVAERIAAAREDASPVRDERADAARPKPASKRKGSGEAVTGLGAEPDDSNGKPSKKPARATGAAASKEKSETKAEADPAAAAAPSKLDRLVTLLRAPGGATLPELQSATGWQVHSVRGAMAGALRKKGYSVTSEKPEGGLRRYWIAETS